MDVLGVLGVVVGSCVGEFDWLSLLFVTLLVLCWLVVTLMLQLVLLLIVGEVCVVGRSVSVLLVGGMGGSCA